MNYEAINIYQQVQARRHGKNIGGAKFFFFVVLEAWLRRGEGVSGRGPELLRGQLPPLPPLWRRPCLNLFNILRKIATTINYNLQIGNSSRVCMLHGLYFQETGQNWHERNYYCFCTPKCIFA